MVDGEDLDVLRTDKERQRVEDGARGVRFIERTVASAASAQKWTAW